MAKRLPRTRLGYYITPHGFGHAVRSLEVVRHLLELEPRLTIHLVSDIPEFLVEQNVGKRLPFRRRKLDVGLIQQDSLRFDLEASLNALQHLYRQRENLVAEELQFLHSEGICGIICDIPFLPFAAATRGGVPSIGIGNFTWDWIYKTYGASDPRWGFLADWIQGCYRCCNLFLQLPMHGDCSVFPDIRDVPLICRKTNRKPEETRKILGYEPDQTLFLISFSSLDLSEETQKHIERINGAFFLYKKPIRFRIRNGRSLDEFPELSYADVVAAVNGVITKPGYGIVSDCLAHGTPVIYTDRGSFPEYEILVKGIEENLAAVYLPSASLYSGNWESALEQLGKMPRRVPRIKKDGALVSAKIILDFFNSCP